MFVLIIFTVKCLQLSLEGWTRCVLCGEGGLCVCSVRSCSCCVTGWLPSIIYLLSHGLMSEANLLLCNLALNCARRICIFQVHPGRLTMMCSSCRRQLARHVLIHGDPVTVLLVGPAWLSPWAFCWGLLPGPVGLAGMVRRELLISLWQLAADGDVRGPPSRLFFCDFLLCCFQSLLLWFEDRWFFSPYALLCDVDWCCRPRTAKDRYMK